MEQIQQGDFAQLEEIGSGASGVVYKVKHKDGRLMARKVVHLTTDAATRAQILRELDLLRCCKSDSVIGERYSLADLG